MMIIDHQEAVQVMSIIRIMIDFVIRHFCSDAAVNGTGKLSET